MEPDLPFDLQLDGAGLGTRLRSLHTQLRAAVLDGRLAAGTALPSSRALAAQLGLGRNTVAAAYARLVAEGYVQPRDRARAVVAHLRPQQHKATAAPPRSPLGLLQPLWLQPDMAWHAPPAWPERSFRLGMPEHRLFPHATWRRLTARHQRAAARGPFAYAPPDGLPALRQAIAGHVAFTRAVACRADDVVVTQGAQQAFDLLARVLVTPGHTRVAVEDPGHPPLWRAFAAAGARVLPVPVDEQGLCVQRLPADVRVVCVTPSHQSPTGVALSAERRRALLDAVRRRGAVIVEDDYDGEFRFGARPLDALQTLDDQGCVFYVGTFSKSLFPALRLGYVVCPPWARAAVVAARQVADGQGDTLMQAVLASFITEGHLARHVRRMQGVYAQRRQLLLQALQGPLSPWLQVLDAQAGLHLAARLRHPAQATAMADSLRRHLPGAQWLADYAHPATAGATPPGVVFGYGAIDADTIGPALHSWRRALQRSCPLPI